MVMVNGKPVEANSPPEVLFKAVMEELKSAFQEKGIEGILNKRDQSEARKAGENMHTSLDEPNKTDSKWTSEVKNPKGHGFER